MLTRTQEFFIGVDGGGTKTHAIVVDGEGHIVGEARAGASNPIVFGLDSAVQAIHQSITRALAKASVKLTEVSAAYLGIAGIEHPDSRASVYEALKALLPDLNFQLGTDA